MSQAVEKKISLRPLGNRVVAKRTEQEETTKGGIILPDAAKEKQETAIIVAVGTGSKAKDGTDLPILVAVGDTVLMDRYSSQEVTIDGEEYIIVKSEDIIAVVEN